MKMQDVEQVGNKKQILENLMDEYGDSIKRLAYSYLRNWESSEDITQEVFLTCYKKLEEFRGESSYKTWLYRITINKCKDQLKSKWFKNTKLANVFIYHLKSTFSVEEEVIKKSEESELALKVYSLPLKYREIIILFYYEQLRLTEIEDLTGLNLETIKTRLRRAKKLLHLKYEEEDQDGK